MDMTLSGVAVYDNINLQVDPTHKAARVSPRPPEKGVFGSYALSLATGAFAAGALVQQPVFAFRWTNPNSCLLRRLAASLSTTTAFAQGDIAVELLRAKGAGAQYTGGANVTLTSLDQTLSTRFQPSAQSPINGAATGNIAIANTAALTAPTPAWALDSNPLAALVVSGTLGLNTSDVWDRRDPHREPLEIRNGEGFLVRVTWPATGVVNPLRVLVEWDEVDPARYF